MRVVFDVDPAVMAWEGRAAAVAAAVNLHELRDWIWEAVSFHFDFRRITPTWGELQRYVAEELPEYLASRGVRLSLD